MHFFPEGRAWFLKFNANAYCSLENQTGRSGKNESKEVSKKKIKKNNIGNQKIPHRNSFAGNESIVNTGNKEHQHAKKLCLFKVLTIFWFGFFFGTKTFLKGFILCKYRKDKQVSGEARSRVNYGWKEPFFPTLYKFYITLKECKKHVT